MASNLLSFISNPLLQILALPIFHLATTFIKPKPKLTRLVFYVHDVHRGHDTTAMPVAGRDGPASNGLKFGTIIAVDDRVTEGPDPNSREIGRAQGLYINSQLDGQCVHMAFSVIFTDGEYKGSTLEIQGSDPISKHDTRRKDREYSVVSGTGYFRFAMGYGVITTELLDMSETNLRAIVKHEVFVRRQ